MKHSKVHATIAPLQAMLPEVRRQANSAPQTKRTSRCFKAGGDPAHQESTTPAPPKILCLAFGKKAAKTRSKKRQSVRGTFRTRRVSNSALARTADNAITQKGWLLNEESKCHAWTV
eukprot:3541609-Amphidinium_carterae.1